MYALTQPQTPANDLQPQRADPPTATQLDDSPDAARYRAILQRKIDDGTRHAASVIAAIQRDQPRDQILRVRAASFLAPPSGGLRVQVGGDWYHPTEFALGQIASRVDVPLPYLRELVGVDAHPWQRELAAEILTRHHGNAGEARVLVRSVRGELRGWVSDKYRRLDSRPLVDALATEAERVGAVPIDGLVTETRVAIKLIFPQVLEPLRGEFIAIGGEWSNSDFGNGIHGFRSFVLRVACLNGLTRENLLKQVHLGARLSDDVEFSDRTHRLDTATSVSVLRDVVRGAFSPASRDRLLESIRAAHDRSMNKPQLTAATRALPKHVQKSVVDAFDSPDVINLPEGNTAWRASNAISWIARNTDDPELRLDLERAAGALV
jgi:hypothetical protein